MLGSCLTYNLKTWEWEQTYSSDGVFREGEKWYYYTCHYGSIEKFGPYSGEAEAKIGFLEHLLWNNVHDEAFE